MIYIWENVMISFWKQIKKYFGSVIWVIEFDIIKYIYTCWLYKMEIYGKYFK